MTTMPALVAPIAGAEADLLASHAREAMALARKGKWVLLGGVVPAVAWLAFAPLASAVVSSGFVKVDLNRAHRAARRRRHRAQREFVRDGQKVKAGEPLMELGDVAVSAGQEPARLPPAGRESRCDPAGGRTTAQSARSPGPPTCWRPPGATTHWPSNCRREQSLFGAAAQLAAKPERAAAAAARQDRAGNRLAACADRPVGRIDGGAEARTRHQPLGSSRTASSPPPASCSWSPPWPTTAPSSKSAAPRSCGPSSAPSTSTSSCAASTTTTASKPATRSKSRQCGCRRSSKSCARPPTPRPGKSSSRRWTVKIMGLRVTNPGTVIAPARAGGRRAAGQPQAGGRSPHQARRRQPGAPGAEGGHALHGVPIPHDAHGAGDGGVRVGRPDRGEQQTQQAYYTVHVEVDSAAVAQATNGEKLQAGMPAEVYLQGGERTPLEYLLEPVTQVLRKARGRER